MTYVPDCDGPRCYFQHANLLLASGAPSSQPFKGNVRVVCFVTDLYRNVFA